MADAVADTTIETPQVETPPITLEIKEAPPANPIDAAAAAAKAAAEAAGETNPVPDKPIKEEVEPTYEYAPTGDAGLDTALEFIGKLGIREDNPAMQAAINGDFTALKALCASLGDKAKGYERFISLGERAYADATAAQTKLAAELKQAVVSEAGDEETWAKVLAWASGEATPAEKTKLNAMLTADPFQAKAAANLLVTQYNRRVNAPLKNPAKHDASGGKAGSAEDHEGPINRRQFAAEARELARKHGDGYMNTPEYRRLAQRHLG